MTSKLFCIAVSALVIQAAAVPAWAQGAQPETPWSIDVSIGWDNSISGDFISGDIGTLQASPVVIEKRKWDDVYGTGTMFGIGVGYALGADSELRGGFTYQSTGSDDTLGIGTLGGALLSAKFDTYKAWGLDFGYRRYFSEAAERWRPYAGGTVGFGSVSGIRADLASTNRVLADTEFYEGNGAFTLGLNGGVLYRLTDRVALDARLGLRYVSGLSDVEPTTFTGLDDVNDGSSRWTLPLTVGARFGF
jgi:hypothetical protein